MKKKTLFVLFAFLMAFCLIRPAKAMEDGYISVQDELLASDFPLSQFDIDTYNEKAQEVRDKFDVDVFYVRDYSISDDSIIPYTENLVNNLYSANTVVAMVINENYFYLYSQGNYSERIDGKGREVWDAMSNMDAPGDKLLAYLAKVVNLCGYDSNFIIDEKSRIPSVSNTVKVVDLDNLLTTEEEIELTQKIKEVIAKHNFDIVVVTSYSLNGLTPMQFADDFFDYNHYGTHNGQDGILFLVSMQERDWWISTKGKGIDYITDYSIDFIRDNYISYLSDAEYYTFFDKCVDYVDKCLTSVEEGKGVIDVDNPVREFTAGHLAGALGGSSVITLIASLILKGRMITVRGVGHAREYVDKSSLRMTMPMERFLRSYVSKTRIEHDSGSSSSGGGGGGGSSSHSSSSGSSHGGGGGKF